jgi:hypothetical protein
MSKLASVLAEAITAPATVVSFTPKDTSISSDLFSRLFSFSITLLVAGKTLSRASSWVSSSYPSDPYSEWSSVDQYTTLVGTSERGTAVSSGLPARAVQGIALEWKSSYHSQDHSKCDTFSQLSSDPMLEYTYNDFF